ncbi:MAG TPA: glycosyltransferase family 39 protein, partial [Acidobacteriota bacterium]|nr:glycosyltransferase family 39 protein [Acidobacteriota bacterium]
MALPMKIRIFLAALALAFVVLYVAVACARIAYPYELEWEEGAHVDHVLRVLSGEKLYVQPSLEFVPFFYTPLYFYVSAAAAKVLGPGFVPLRLVSILASLAAFWILFSMVRRETGSAAAGILAAGLFAATYKISGAWFDLARVDSLFLCLLLAGLFALRFMKSGMGAVWAGTLIALSFLTKQTALAAASLPILAAIALNRRLGLIACGTFVGIAGLSTLLLDRLHDGWYTYYLFGIGGFPIEKSMVLGFWTRDLLFKVPVALAASVAALASLRTDRTRLLFYGAAILSMVLSSWFFRLHTGGYSNVLFPAYAMIAALAAWGIHDACSRPKPIDWLAGLLCVAQFALLSYNPFTRIPTAADRKAGDELIRKLSQIEGDVLIPYHGYYSVLAGKRPHAHVSSMIDIVVSGDPIWCARLVDDI